MATPSDASAIGARRSAAADIRATRDARTTIFKRARPTESVIQAFLLFCGVLSIFTTIGIVYVLGTEALLFFGSGAVDLFEFFTAPRWQPQSGEFGIMPLVSATLMTTFFGMLVAIPLGLGAAIYLSEYAKERTRATLKPILEILAGIPTVVYGYFALTFMTPVLRSLFGQDTVSIYNVSSAGLVMGIMILPTIASMSEDALSAVPRSLREASYGLGATKIETILQVVLPAALSGVIAAFIVGISRAVGETMIVALAAGAGPCILYGANSNCFQPFGAAETMTGHIVRISGGDLSYNSIDYTSLFAIGLTLFLFTLVLNLISRYITNRFREVYQ
ncbi:MAG: phosphate ABC transporter permease subunit PstC [bacterium]|nr:phosphate ABC transporter permease subunit PstC [bacterium]